MKTISIDGTSLTIDLVYEIAHSCGKDLKVELTSQAREKILQARSYVDKIVSSGKADGF